MRNRHNWSDPVLHSGRPQQSRRRHQRKTVEKAVVLHHQGQQFPAVLRDISHSGARIELYPGRARMTLSRNLRLDMPGLGMIPAQIRWRDGAQMGVAFALPQARLGTLRSQIDRLFGFGP